MKSLFRFFNNSLSSVFLFVFILLGLLVLVNQTGVAGQGASPWIKTEQTSIRLLTNVSAIGNSQNIQLGLQFKLEPGWKIYWRSPGDAGYPPRLNWKRSENLKKVNFGWPLPIRFSVSGIQTIGYKKEVVFPIGATINDQNKRLKLRADLDYLACNEICIPYKAALSLDIPTGSAADRLSENYRLINQYIERIPGNGIIHKLKISGAETTGSFFEPKENIRKGFITIKTKSGIPYTKPDIFIEGPELIFFGAPKVQLNKNQTTATFVIPFIEEENAKIINSKIRLTLKDGDRSAEDNLRVKLSGGPQKIEVKKLSLLLTLGFALLGGLILNLMPCVLPVISLKVLSIVSYSGLSKQAVRLSFIATALGIIFSFLVIGGGLMSLKFAGSAVGWGIQFQHPWFIVALSIIVAFFAYNLWGLFELRLPSSISNFANGSGDGIQSSNNFSKNFITGAFATILATPCSAPFLGTAVGFALAGSIIDILTIFLALGTGMALPYIIIAAFPGFADKLPKPGIWMVTIKKILGVALVATTIWLLSILAIQVSLKAALIISALLILIGLSLVIKIFQKENYPLLTTSIIIVSILGAFWVPYNFKNTLTQIDSPKEAYWQNFNPEIIQELVKSGKTVFVDITAEWCITCKVNKAIVLERKKFKDLIKSKQIIAMQGDWTKPDERISNYLRKFDRFGIPFNAVYGPGIKLGEALPELLTTDTVLDSLQKASKEKLMF
jgi:suppressor for copper-sensitivity B